MRCAPNPALPPGCGKPGNEMAPEEANAFKLLGHCDFGGRNKGGVMQLLVKGDFILCGQVNIPGCCDKAKNADIMVNHQLRTYPVRLRLLRKGEFR